MYTHKPKETSMRIEIKTHSSFATRARMEFAMVPSTPPPAPGTQKQRLNLSAQEWAPMYNDRIEVDDGGAAMAGLSSNDTRARSAGPVGWASPLANTRVRWNERYVGERPGWYNPTDWIETSSGFDLHVRAKLQATGRQEVQARARSPPSAAARAHRASFLAQTTRPVYKPISYAKFRTEVQAAAHQPITGGEMCGYKGEDGQIYVPPWRQSLSEVYGEGTLRAMSRPAESYAHRARRLAAEEGARRQSNSRSAKMVDPNAPTATSSWWDA